MGYPRASEPPELLDCRAGTERRNLLGLATYTNRLDAVIGEANEGQLK
jgi:hypothetical protein